jgi:hypothetical protein
MSNKNDITGDRIINKKLSKEGEDNWDRIFKKQGITLTEEELANVEIIADIVQHHHDKKELPEYELNKSTGEVQKIDSKKLTDAYNGH